MKGTCAAVALAAGLGLALASCGGSAGGAPGTGGSAGIGIDLAYETPATPRAQGLARTLADSLPPSDPAPRPPSDTWLRVQVTGPDFAPVICQFPRRGGECGGIPAGTGRVVTVEEWDATFGTLYFRGQVGGVAVMPGRSTRVQVSMRAPVAVQYPAADGGVNLPTFTAIVQTEPHAKVLLYLGSHLAGTRTADESGVAEIPVDGGGPTVPPRPDGTPGLPDGDYLLTAVALPPASPGGTPVRHQGTPHAFAVDLLPPSLALSGPSLTGADVVDVSGVTEPGVRVRCGRGRAEGEVTVGPDGRFVRLAFPLTGPATRIVCDATDRAGNVTTRDLVVAFLPEGFAIEASLPDVTRQTTETLRVTTDPTIEDLKIDIVGELTHSTRETIAGRQAQPGTFEVPLVLFENQWNRVRVSARVGGVVLGSAEVAVEHDSVPPRPPVWITTLGQEPSALSEAEFVVDRFYLSYATIVLEQPEAGGRLEIFHSRGARFEGSIAADGGLLPTEPPSDLMGYTTTDAFPVPPGTCYGNLLARAIDRAGNTSLGWSIAGLAFMGVASFCVR